MSTGASINVMQVCLLLIGFVLYLHDLPHRQAGYSHRDCDVCEGVSSGRRIVPSTRNEQDGAQP